MTAAVELRPHQKRAVADINALLDSEPRCSYISACGTGKTLSSLSVAEESMPEDALIVVATPTIALTMQTMEEWSRLAGLAFGAIVVSSGDSTRKNVVSTTDVDVIQEWMRANKADRRIVFTTHVSLPVAQEAFVAEAANADLLVIDEAHRVAGKPSDMKTTATSTFPAAKRLFMTATPRISKAGGGPAALSMDDPAQFGEIAHTLSFGEAITNTPPLLSDYRLVALACSDTNDFDVGSANGQQTMHQAIDMARHRYGFNRTLTFHSSINAADAFASEHPNQCTAAAVESFAASSRDTNATRKSVLKSFSNADTATTLSNAKLFTEGIDIPGIDSVAFCSPKSSVVDIVQAAGRALRLDPSNPDKVATIIVPIPVVDGEILAGDSNLVNVLLAMRDVDDRLDAVVSNHKGSRMSDGSVPIDWMGFDTVEAGQLIDLDLHVLERVNPSSLWFDNMDKYASFVKAHGRGPVKSDGDEDLIKWATSQRSKYKAGRLPEEQVAAMRLGGFAFNPRTDAFRIGHSPPKYVEGIWLQYHQKRLTLTGTQTCKGATIRGQHSGIEYTAVISKPHTRPNYDIGYPRWRQVIGADCGMCRGEDDRLWETVDALERLLELSIVVASMRRFPRSCEERQGETATETTEAQMEEIRQVFGNSFEDVLEVAVSVPYGGSVVVDFSGKEIVMEVVPSVDGD